MTTDKTLRATSLLQRTGSLLDTACRGIVLICCLGMAMVTGAQVLFRYGLNNSLFWSEELGRVLLVQLTFYGAAVAYRAGVHIGVDTIVCRLSPRLRLIARIITHCACLFLFCIMAYYGFQFTAFLSHQLTTTLGISRQLPFSAIPVSGCIMAVHCLCSLSEIFSGSSGGSCGGLPDGAPHESDTRGIRHGGQA